MQSGMKYPTMSQNREVPQLVGSEEETVDHRNVCGTWHYFPIQSLKKPGTSVDGVKMKLNTSHMFNFGTSSCRGFATYNRFLLWTAT